MSNIKSKKNREDIFFIILIKEIKLNKFVKKLILILIKIIYLILELMVLMKELKNIIIKKNFFIFHYLMIQMLLIQIILIVVGYLYIVLKIMKN